MLVDGNDLSGDLDCDVCVVGAGAAGIAIALQLRDTRLAVALIESGGLERDAATQALYESTQSGIPTGKLHLNRLRYLGGTTGHWGGWCRPLDAIDFERRGWVPYSGWPFGREELDRYYRPAHALCEVDSPDYDPARWTTADDQDRGLLLPGEPLRNIVFLVSDPPTRFGTRYRGDLEAAPNITTYLRSNVIEVETDGNARHVTGLRLATLAGNRFRMRAKVYVLASGAVENARLLLSSDSVQASGLGNGHDLVGRFFGQHPCVRKTHCVTFTGDVLQRFARRGSRPDVRIASGVSERVAREDRILNSHFLFLLDRKREEVGMLRALYERFAGRPGGDSFEDAIADLLGEFGQEPEGDRGGRRFFTIEERAEQAPNPSSRVTLGSERDPLGMRRIDMDWRLGDLDLLTLRRTREILIREFGTAGLGRVKDWPEGYNPIEPSEETLHGGHHHYGTTRMHDDPRQGVVDAECRVHGIDNLYIAGSSVFPTTGYANPTLTIVALALRLSETIAARLS